MTRIAVMNHDKCKPKKCNQAMHKILPHGPKPSRSHPLRRQQNPHYQRSSAADAVYASRNAPSKPSASSTCQTSWRRIAVTASAKTPSNFSVYLCLRRELCWGCWVKTASAKAPPSKCSQAKSNRIWATSRTRPTGNTIIQFYRGSSLQDYFQKMSEGNLKVSHKPQYVDRIPKAIHGKVSELLEKVDQRKVLG